MKTPSIKLPRPRLPRLRRRTGEGAKPDVPHKLPGSWALAKLTTADFLADWKPYLKILAVVTIPIDLASLFSVFSSDPQASAYMSFAAIIMNVALIWAIVRRQENGKVPGIAHAYYDSSVALVRFLLVSVVLVLFLIPAGLGGALYTVALSSSGVANISAPEILLIGLVALVLTAPTVYLFVRFGLAPMVVVRDGLRPLAALRASRRLSLGRFWPLAGRFLMLGLFVVAISIPAVVLTALLTFLKLPALSTFVFEVASTFIVLPFSNIYLLRLYRALGDSPATESKAQ